MFTVSEIRETAQRQGNVPHRFQLQRQALVSGAEVLHKHKRNGAFSREGGKKGAKRVTSAR